MLQLNRPLHVALWLLASALAACGQRSTDETLVSPVELRPAAIRAHTAYLASDLLEGREAGKRGYDLAAGYVAAQFEASGLDPGGDNGTYLQAVPLQTRTLVPDSVRFAMTTPQGTFRFANGEDIAVDASALETDQRVEGEVVFVGFGIVAPELGHDDYAGLDVHGKFVAVFASAPVSFPGTLRAHYGLSDHKQLVAAARGAVGMLLLKTPSWEKISSWDYTRKGLPLPRMTWVGRDGTPYVPAPQIRASVALGPKAAAALFDGAPQEIESLRASTETGTPQGFPLDVFVSIARRSVHEIAPSPNVIGIVRGSDPALAEELVVVTSHLDHVGIGEPVNGDRIYNGATDNGVGIAIILELAHALAAEQHRLRRSVVFVATTAEEKGLIGAEYFAQHPTVPLEQIVANINIDGMDGFYEFGDIVGYGAEHSTLGRVLEAAVRGTGVAVSPDPEPEQLIFTRSDQYPFVKRGIPALFVLTGNATGRDGKSGEEITDWFMQNHYHQPSDDMQLPWNWPAVALFGEIHRRLLRDIANATERPRWYKGDFFGEMFAPQAPKARPDVPSG